ncbi:uncharacterized protein TRUGW13939_10625 [Talaromyces rugulosus]|uniref:Uncharacterized protein n=1 Tax=Talaromyces rugulosus TaxID=121627 RepID=A0A7H8RD57_TALRU|nr:uncharacterized protein TRUGW13939_10625 [Talaromyces rugulosus]QKX63455.1 hypothetical protein TRUGW13939_10625 [Talaromyces rugulosus]
MSDDEYYEDDDDWYWYEDEYTGIGDDLAATAVHSPIMVEDPSLEIVETFSDWEYYSDDYYDDDPSIIKKQGTESGSAEGHTDGPPRKKKRKLSALQDVPTTLSLGPAIVDGSSSPTDANSFQGVLWRRPPAAALGKEEITLYEPGKGEKVALLSDWREVFKSSLARTDWFQNGVNPQEDDDMEKQQQHLEPIVREEVTPEIQENGVRENRYATYSPPPLEIDDMNKSINRQREKNIQPDLGKPQSNLREMMVVGDSEEGEPEEIEESAAAPLEEPADAEVEDENMEQQQEETEKEPTTRKKMLRVEVPAPSSNVTNSSPPRKRGRKPKDATSTKQQQKPQKSPVITSDNNKVSNPKKRGASSLQVDENDEPDSKRRSRRIASVSETQPEQKRVPAKSNRGRKRNV